MIVYDSNRVMALGQPTMGTRVNRVEVIQLRRRRSYVGQVAARHTPPNICCPLFTAIKSQLLISY